MMPCVICALLCSMYSYFGMEDKPVFWVQWNVEHKQAQDLDSKSESDSKAGDGHDRNSTDDHSAQARKVVNPVVSGEFVVNAA
jgi:hypothetical protein